MVKIVVTTCGQEFCVGLRGPQKEILWQFYSFVNHSRYKNTWFDNGRRHEREYRSLGKSWSGKISKIDHDLHYMSSNHAFFFIKKKEFYRALYFGILSRIVNNDSLSCATYKHKKRASIIFKNRLKNLEKRPIRKKIKSDGIIHQYVTGYIEGFEHDLQEFNRKHKICCPL